MDPEQLLNNEDEVSLLVTLAGAYNVYGNKDKHSEYISKLYPIDNVCLPQNCSNNNDNNDSFDMTLTSSSSTYLEQLSNGLQNELLQYLSLYSPQPPQSLLRMPMFINDDKLKYIMPNNSHFKMVIYLYNQKLSIMTIPEMYTELNNGMPVFRAVNRNIYMAREDSFAILNDWTKFQFRSSKKRCRAFWTLVYQFVNR